MTLRVLVVDDEPLARVGVVTRLAFHKDVEVIGECEDGSTAIEAIRDLAPDLTFLDVHLPDISGLEVLRALPRPPLPRVVFLTAHEDYALDAFDVHALDYLLKPIDDERFGECLDRARRIHSLTQPHAVSNRAAGELPKQQKSRDDLTQRFEVRDGDSLLFVRAGDVDWFEALGDYTGLHVGKRIHLIREPIGSLANRLDPNYFLRIHRSAIIRIDRLAKIKPLSNRDCVITLRDGQIVRGSRTFSDQLYQALRSGSEKPDDSA